MSIVQIIKRVANLGRDVARDAVEHNSEFIDQIAKRVEEVHVVLKYVVKIIILMLI